jgi:hypothetical protein
MPLPNHDRAHVDRRKLTEYLLNRNHPDAKGKSAFFAVVTGATGSACGTIYSSMPKGRLRTSKKPGTARGTL